MREVRVATRYSRALFMCVEEESALVQIEGELAALSSVMSDRGSDLRTLLLNPAFRKEERAQVVNIAAAALSLHPLSKNLLLVLIENGRAEILPLIAKAFSDEIDGKLGRVRAHVTSAAPLNDQELSDIVESLRQRAGKNVVAEVAVDANVGMGVKAQIGGLVFDATLSTMLERFKRKLVDAPIGA